MAIEREVAAVELMALCGVSRATVTAWVRAGIPSVKRGADRRFPVPEALAWWRDRAVAAAIEGERGPDPEWRRARAAKMRAQAAREEMALARDRRELVPVDEAADVVSQALTALRAGLVGIPSRWAPDVVGLTTLPMASAKLDALVDKLLVTLQGSDFRGAA